MGMAPNVRRSWAPRGRTPILRQRTRRHQKVSMIAALCVSPERDRVQLFFRLHPDANIDTAMVIEFLQYLSRELEGAMVLIWDRLLTHRSKRMSEFLAGAKNINVKFLPPYAPELNPVENVWSYLKNNPLANFAVFDVDTLAYFARRNGRSIQNRQPLLLSFVRHSPLSLRLN
jgi:transposase